MSIGDHYAAKMSEQFRDMAKEQHKRDNPAEYLFSSLTQRLRIFQGTLDDDHELGVSLVSGGNLIFRVKSYQYKNPNLIIFTGEDLDGSQIELVQHFTQLSVAFIAVKKVVSEEPPYRLGFI